MRPGTRLAGVVLAVGAAVGTLVVTAPPASAWPTGCSKGVYGLNRVAWADCTGGTGQFRVIVQYDSGEFRAGPWRRPGQPGASEVSAPGATSRDVGWELRN